MSSRYKEGFNVILADPPWDFRQKLGSRGADKKYSTIPDKALMDLDVGSLGAANCTLFLWTTASHLPVAINLMEKWGFKYNTVAFTWVKTKKNSPLEYSMGMGFSTRSNAEFCLLGKRGSLERKDKAVHSIVAEPRGPHSAKPEAVREGIERLYGDVPRLELFARYCRAGWVQTGFEMDGRDISDFISFWKDWKERVPDK